MVTWHIQSFQAYLRSSLDFQANPRLDGTQRTSLWLVVSGNRVANRWMNPDLECQGNQQPEQSKPHRRIHVALVPGCWSLGMVNLLPLTRGLDHLTPNGTCHLNVCSRPRHLLGPRS